MVAVGRIVFATQSPFVRRWDINIVRPWIRVPYHGIGIIAFGHIIGSVWVVDIATHNYQLLNRNGDGYITQTRIVYAIIIGKYIISVMPAGTTTSECMFW